MTMEDRVHIGLMSTMAKHCKERRFPADDKEGKGKDLARFIQEKPEQGYICLIQGGMQPLRKHGNIFSISSKCLKTAVA